MSMRGHAALERNLGFIISIIFLVDYRFKIGNLGNELDLFAELQMKQSLLVVKK